MLAEAALRWLVARRKPAFEQELARLSHEGSEGQVLEFIDRQRLLAFAAPRGYLQGKLAAVYRQFGRHRSAAEAFRQALEDAPAAAVYPLALGLADSLYELGEEREAERAYRKALDEEHAPARACLHLSRLIRHRGGDLQEAEGLLRRSLEEQPDLRCRCELVMLLAERNKVDEAIWQLQLCKEALAEDQSEPVGLQEQMAAAERAIEAARARPVEEPEAAPSRTGR